MQQVQMKITHVTSECRCGRAIKATVPWDPSLRERGAFVKCTQCGHIIHGEARYNE